MSDPSVAEPSEVVAPEVESPDAVGSLDGVLCALVATEVLSAVVVLSADVVASGEVDSGVAVLLGAVASALVGGGGVCEAVAVVGVTEELGVPVTGAVDVCVGSVVVGPTTSVIRALNSSSLASISAGGGGSPDSIDCS